MRGRLSPYRASLYAIFAAHVKKVHTKNVREQKTPQLKQSLLFPDLGNLKPPPYKHDLYESASEERCSRFLQKYVSGWRPIRGVTVQVPIDNDRAVDFRVKDTLVEFHPIMPWKEMRSVDALEKMVTLYKSLGAEDRELLKTALREELLTHYIKYRKTCLQACRNPNIRNLKLIVCSSEVEFYGRVLVPYADISTPKVINFLNAWNI